MKSKQRMKFRLYTYDLWSDGEGGLTVNDVYQQGVIEVDARLTVYGEDTEYEFMDYSLTDRQLNRALGARGFEWDGDLDGTMYATDKKGNPACELRRMEDSE